MFFYYKDCNYQIIAFTNGYSKKTGKKSRYVKCICMNLWGVAILELYSHPDFNKGPDQCETLLMYTTAPVQNLKKKEYKCNITNNNKN